MTKPTYTIIFYQEDSGKEPVKQWLKKLKKLLKMKLKPLQKEKKR